MEKKISIIIPCYNVEKYVSRCINSLINQTIGLENLELIFVNDASTDRTLEILKEYESQFSDDILVIDLETNIRQGGARNVGLQYASADFIGFVDADDWVEVTMYEKLFNKATEYDCDLVCCKYKRVEDENTPMGRTGEQDGFYQLNSLEEHKAFILDGADGGICCNLYKKSIIDDNQIFFPEKMAYEDNFWLPILKLYIKSFYVIKEYLYHYYLNMQSTITTKDSLHHFDRLSIELMKIKEYEKRGVLIQFYEEIELQFLKLYFINTLNIMFTRFSVLYVDIFYEMQRTLLKCFPNYKDNQYINTKMNEVDRYLLPLIEMKITPQELRELAVNYRRGYLSLPKK